MGHLTLKVAKVPILDWLTRMIASVGDIEKIKLLKLGTIKQNIIQTKEELDKWSEGIVGWSFPVDFTSKRGPYLARLDACSAACKEVSRHVKAVTATHNEKMSFAGKAKQSWRTERNKIRTYLLGRGVPACVAKFVADLWFSQVYPPESVGITLPIDSPTCPL